MYPISFAADHVEEGRNRLTTFFRYFIAIPWLLVNMIYGIGAGIAVTIAWFVMIFTGRYPEGLYNFNAGYLRQTERISSYYYLLTDEFPPFGGEEGPDYPVRIGVAPPLDKYSRAKAFFRYIIGIPVMILALVQSLILTVVTLVAWFAILFTGRHSDGLFNPARSAMAYLTRASAYFLLMTEDWPPFSDGSSEAVPAGEISTEAASRKA